MTAFDDMVTADLGVIMTPATGEFAQLVSRYPLGVVASAIPVDAIWTADKRGPLSERTAPLLDEVRGREVWRFGCLQVLSSIAVSVKDSWLVNSEVWQVDRLGSAQHGLREIYVKRTDGQTRTAHR